MMRALTHTLCCALLACGSADPSPAPNPPPTPKANATEHEGAKEAQASNPQGDPGPTTKAPTPGGPPKHVLLLSVDTLRPDYLSGSGYDRPTSPYIDAVMAAGTTFTEAISPIGRTTPALASLHTGAYPHGSQVRRLNDTLPDDRLTLAELAKGAGFQTMAVVSNHIMSPARRLDQGFDHYDYGKDTRDAKGTTADALAHLATLDASKPIFAWVHYIDPHAPYYPPPKIAEAFDPGYDGRYAKHFGSKPGGVGGKAYPDDLPKKQAVFNNPLPERVNDHVRRLYAADIRATDLAIADLIKTLRAETGQDWLIVFTSDHGESLGENDYFWDHGDYASSAELRVPLSFTMPPGHPLPIKQRLDGWVSLVDVFPTVVDIMGWTVPELPYAIDGISLLDHMRDGTAPTHAVFGESGTSHFKRYVKRRVQFTVEGRFRAVYKGDHKLIWTPGLEPQPYQLFAPRTDPAEANDLWGQHEAEASALKDALHAWVRNDAAPEGAMDEDEMKALRELGYME